jgi:asparagine synthase (glutamine-hydrolysing)
MCGIVGMFQATTPVDRERLLAMRDMLTSRGPDDAGEWVSADQRVGLGHRRLAIIDTSPAGHQPMAYAGRLMSCYNGEIYNYRDVRRVLEGSGYQFQTATDTEVLLAAYDHWGPDCLSELDGIFAFAIYDTADRSLFLARDQAGVKPLYYCASASLLVFGSRLRALLQHRDVPREVCPTAVRLYLELGYVPAPRTILSGVRKLEPGEWRRFRVSDDELRVESGQAPPPPAPASLPSDDRGWIDAIDGAVMRAVGAQMVSDVPIGAFLSGGVDSSLVAATMQRHSASPIRTFTVGFVGAGDESRQAAAVAAHLGTDHEQMMFAASDLLDFLDVYAREFDEPLADSSGLPSLVVSEMASRHVRVCLGGDGGDELFGGYRNYGYLDRMAPLWSLPRPLRRLAGAAVRAGGRSGHRARLLAAAIESGNAVDTFALMRTLSKDRAVATLVVDEGEQSARDLIADVFDAHADRPPSDRACRFDLRSYLVDDILQKVDVSSMAYSLEARVPLLAPEVRALADHLPPDLKRRGSTTKWALREVLYRHVPRALVDRPKQGFEVPLREWFRGELRDFVQDALSPAAVARFGLLRQDGVAAVLDAHLSGRQDTHPLLWALTSLLRWDQDIRQQGRS